MAWRIILDSLHCDDAEEARDEPYILLNGTRVWNAERVRTGDTRSIGVSRRLEDDQPAVIELWENDADYPFDGKHSDQLSHVPDGFISTSPHMRVTRGMIRLLEEGFSRSPYPVQRRFTRGSGHIGSATYTLNFSLERA